MITFQTEPWSDFEEEGAALCVRHWEEIALNKDAIKLDPDWQRYRRIDAEGLLSVTTAREEGKLVGYQVYIVTPHLHYKSSLTALSDVLYLAPEHRQGTTGIRLMKAAEEALVKRGVQKVVQNVKLKNDWGLILERMGYSPIERIYAKMLKG